MTCKMLKFKEKKRHSVADTAYTETVPPKISYMEKHCDKPSVAQQICQHKHNNQRDCFK